MFVSWSDEAQKTKNFKDKKKEKRKTFQKAKHGEFLKAYFHCANTKPRTFFSSEVL